MNRTKRIAVVPLGVLFVMLLPGFSWITWPSFVIGLAWAFACGWHIALVFAPVHNFFAARSGKLRSA